jgi:DNA (cytosine-5)-methyltransferase 1
MSERLTYISLFSCAGIGCYGFKQAGFDCVATSELIERRLNIQKYNNKCKYDTGYICGDITKNETKNELFNQIQLWKDTESISDITVVVATPPCQGMSTANTNKNDKDIIRNSLVIEAISIIEKIKPKFFVFENVPSFLKTNCIDHLNNNVSELIETAISKHLSKYYAINYSILNFAYYGSNSSRTRTIVIGVRNDININPKLLFPNNHIAPNLKELIGNLPSLNFMGEISDTDIYHGFREYSKEMFDWIHNTPEGCSAFDNVMPEHRPHKIKEGNYVLNKRAMSTKYSRCFWNKIAPCVLTRNDTVSGFSTIHPKDDRVFSIRELMLMQTIPYEFNWTDKSFEELNSLPLLDKKQYLKDNEINIRQCIGEAVPTIIFNQIANKIKTALINPTKLKHIPKCDFGTLNNENLHKLF